MWLQGLSSRDISENVLWDLGFSEGYHTQPTVTGDSRLLNTFADAAGFAWFAICPDGSMQVGYKQVGPNQVGLA